MTQHLAKHGMHLVLIVGALLMIQLADIELSTIGLVAILAVCLVAFEGGLWLLHRRDASRANSA